MEKLRRWDLKALISEKKGFTRKGKGKQREGLFERVFRRKFCEYISKKQKVRDRSTFYFVNSGDQTISVNGAEAKILIYSKQSARNEKKKSNDEKKKGSIEEKKNKIKN